MPPSKKSAAAAAAKKGEAETDDQGDFPPFAYMPSVLQDEAVVMLLRKSVLKPGEKWKEINTDFLRMFVSPRTKWRCT